MSITIFVADDHGIVREGISCVLNNVPEFMVVGEAGNSQDAVKGVMRLQPNVVIMDIAMPILNGVQATRRLAEDAPDTAIAILTVHNSSEYIYQLLNAGARGYVLKDSVSSELIKAIHAIHSGKRYLSESISETLITDYIIQRNLGTLNNPITQLSLRELEVLHLVAEGHSSKEIGKQLALSPKTIDSYRSRLMAKLNLQNIPQLVKFAIQHGIVELT